METYQFITQIAKLQGVQLIDVYNSSNKENENTSNNSISNKNNENKKTIIKIAVAIRKKLVILQWNQDSFEKLNVNIWKLRYYIIFIIELLKMLMNIININN